MSISMYTYLSIHTYLGCMYLYNQKYFMKRYCILQYVIMYVGLKVEKLTISSVFNFCIV